MAYGMFVDVGFAHSGVFVAEITDDGFKPVYWKAIHTVKSDKKLNIRKANDDLERIKHTAAELIHILSQFPLVKIIAAEIPSGGGQSAAAIRSMGMATAVIGALAAVFDKKAWLYVTPSDVKVAMSGGKAASKDYIQAKAREMYPDTAFPKTKKDFEHIADAIGVSEAVKDDSLIRLLRS